MDDDAKSSAVDEGAGGSGADEPVRIVVTRDPEVGSLDPLRALGSVRVLERYEAENRDRLLASLAGARAVLTMLVDAVDTDFLDAAPDLEIVSNMAVGYDNVDVEAASARGVIVCNTPDVLTETTAELTVALLFAVSRRIAEGDRFIRDGRWKRWSPGLLLGYDLAGRSFGVVGAGRIGGAVARRVHALGMRVLYASRSRSVELEEELGAQRRELDDLLGEADVVSLHVPLVEETRRLIDRRRLGLMHPDAILLNTARGPLVDERALVDALGEGRLFGAGLDVFAREPEVEPRLLGLENVVLTPHIGSASVATRRRMADMAVENLVRHLRGERPLSVVDETVSGR